MHFMKLVNSVRFTWSDPHQRQWGLAQQATQSSHGSAPSKVSQSSPGSRSFLLRWRNHPSVCPHTPAHPLPEVVRAPLLGLKQQEFICEHHSRYKSINMCGCEKWRMLIWWYCNQPWKRKISLRNGEVVRQIRAWLQLLLHCSQLLKDIITWCEPIFEKDVFTSCEPILEDKEELGHHLFTVPFKAVQVRPHLQEQEHVYILVFKTLPVSIVLLEKPFSR